MTFGPDEIREARTLTSTGPEMLAKNYVTKLRTTLIAALDALEEAQKDNKKMSAMLDRIANHPTVADYFHAPSEECVADGVEGAIEDLEARAEKAERELGEAQKELETVRMDAAKEAARAARTILGNERTRAEKAERERDEARESLQRLSQVKFHTEHEYAKVFSRAEAAEAKVRELEGSLSAQSWEKMEKDLEVVDHLSADLLRERERVQELEERLEQWEGPPHAKAAKPLHGKTTLGRLQVEQERVRELEGVLRWIAFGEGHPIGDGSPKDEARAALSHHKTYGEVAQIPSEGPGRGAGAGEREQPVVNRKDVGSSAPALVSHPKEVKPLPRPEDESPCRARIKELEVALRDLLNWRATGAGERGREAAERAQAALAGDKDGE